MAVIIMSFMCICMFCKCFVLSLLQFRFGLLFVGFFFLSICLSLYRQTFSLSVFKINGNKLSRSVLSPKKWFSYSLDWFSGDDYKAFISCFYLNLQPDWILVSTNEINTFHEWINTDNFSVNVLWYFIGMTHFQIDLHQQFIICECVTLFLRWKRKKPFQNVNVVFFRVTNQPFKGW